VRPGQDGTLHRTQAKERKMPDKDNGVLYTYGWIEKAGRYGAVLFTCVFAPIIVAALFIAVSQGWDQIASRSTRDLILIVVGSLLGLLIAVLFPLLVSSTDPSIRISDMGISVQVFLFWWVLVPWEEVQEVKKRFLLSSRLVVVRRLTLIHRLIGSTATGFRPAFVLKRSLIGFDEAVKTIEQRIARRQNSPKPFPHA
jgi:hypothetical protein